MATDGTGLPSQYGGMPSFLFIGPEVLQAEACSAFNWMPIFPFVGPGLRGLESRASTNLNNMLSSRWFE